MKLRGKNEQLNRKRIERGKNATRRKNKTGSKKKKKRQTSPAKVKFKFRVCKIKEECANVP